MAGSAQNNTRLADTQLNVYEITDKSINAVPKVVPLGWLDDMASKLQQAHKDLLTEMKEYPAGTEGAAVYDLSISKIGNTIIGEPGGYSVSVEHIDQPRILIHNHPDDNILSHTDIERFLGNENIQALSAVGNNGSVYMLQKLSNYDGYYALTEYLKVKPTLEAAVSNKDIDRYLETINTYFERIKVYGTDFTKRTARAT